jgi:Domain of unknown function (DUF4136)
MSASLLYRFALLAGLAACTGLSVVNADVSSYGDWPAGRKPGSYAFERLPSQQARAEQQQLLEDAARPALAKAGFTAAADAGSADVVVTVGARVSRTDYAPWDDPLWLRGGFYGWRYPRYYSSLAWRYSPPRYEREVALLIRDRASTQALHEARASSDGSTGAGAEFLAALYQAALADFPRTGLNPRPVSVPLAAP